MAASVYLMMRFGQTNYDFPGGEELRQADALLMGGESGGFGASGMEQAAAQSAAKFCSNRLQEAAGRAVGMKFRGRAVLEFTEYGSRAGLFDNGDAAQPSRHQVMETNFCIITSKENLRRAAEKLDLKSRFQTGTAEEAADRLYDMLEVKHDRESGHTAIEAFSEDPAQAAELANAVGDAYLSRREEVEKERAIAVREVLESKQNEQAAKVAEARNRMIAVQRQFMIVDTTSIISEKRTVADPYDLHVPPEVRLAEMKMEVKKLQDTLSQMESAEGAELIKVAAALLAKDAIMADCYPQYQSSKMELDTLLFEGMGPKHPAVLALLRKLSGTEAIVLGAVEGCREQIRISLESVNAQIIEAARPRDEKREKDIETGAVFTIYAQARHEYEMQVELLLEMREHFQKLDAQPCMPRRSVQFRERAVASSVPVQRIAPLSRAAAGMEGKGVATFCSVRGKCVIFLFHVPGLEDVDAEAKTAVGETAWRAAVEGWSALPRPRLERIVAGIRGGAGYDHILEGGHLCQARAARVTSGPGAAKHLGALFAALPETPPAARQAADAEEHSAPGPSKGEGAK